MATRSNIIVHRADGTWKRIYCHNDGYIEHHGPILLRYYNDQAKAEALVEPGDMSSLHPSCDKPEGHSFDHRVDGYCVYYGRDRAETDVGGQIGKSLKSVSDDLEDYVYVFKKGCWWFGPGNRGVRGMKKLQDAYRETD